MFLLYLYFVFVLLYCILFLIQYNECDCVIVIELGSRTINVGDAEADCGMVYAVVVGRTGKWPVSASSAGSVRNCRVDAEIRSWPRAAAADTVEVGGLSVPQRFF